MSYVLNEVKFLTDVADHQIQVIRDDGVNRHIRFAKPGTGCMHFDLITWPGCLCYTGDMGTFVFARIADMFDFFRTKPEGRDGLHINPGYWSEKVLAADRDGIERFSEQKFRAVIADYVENSSIPNAGDDAEIEVKRLLSEEIESEVLRYIDDGEHEAMRAAYNFEFNGFVFQDLFEHDFKEHTHRFTWCCYALAWGIAKYDSAKESVAVAA